MYKVRCYKRSGALDHEAFFNDLGSAKQERTEWGLSIGLRPEPSTDFAYYPTIWEKTDAGDEWKRIEGF